MARKGFLFHRFDLVARVALPGEVLAHHPRGGSGWTRGVSGVVETLEIKDRRPFAWQCSRRLENGWNSGKNAI